MNRRVLVGGWEKLLLLALLGATRYLRAGLAIRPEADAGLVETSSVRTDLLSAGLLDVRLGIDPVADLGLELVKEILDDAARQIVGRRPVLGDMENSVHVFELTAFELDPTEVDLEDAGLVRFFVGDLSAGVDVGHSVPPGLWL